MGGCIPISMGIMKSNFAHLACSCLIIHCPFFHDLWYLTYDALISRITAAWFSFMDSYFSKDTGSTSRNVLDFHLRYHQTPRCTALYCTSRKTQATHHNRSASKANSKKSNAARKRQPFPFLPSPSYFLKTLETLRHFPTI